MTTKEERSSTDAGGGSTFAEVQQSEEFQGLKRTLRRFVFPATVLFLAWYVLYILLSAYARDFMATKLLGNINVAYVLGLSQFVSTFVIAYVYSKYADKHFDPTADRIRHRLEGTTAAPATTTSKRTRS
ncbi:MAG: rane protein-like protein [Frankiales bacterium]|nr:rane protein-like protein [Frankiales bacterium]